MAAKKRRMVWRISDIVRAICKERGRPPPYEDGADHDGAYVLAQCARSAGDVDYVIGLSPYSLPVVLGLPPGYDPVGTSAALIAAAKRLGVKQVPA